MARPARNGSAARQVLRIRVTDEERAALERAAQVNRTDLAGVIREAVNEYVADYGEVAIFAGFRRPKFAKGSQNEPRVN